MRALVLSLLISGLGILPAVAQEKSVKTAYAAMASGDLVKEMTGATMLCLLGKLDGRKTAKLFANAGWKVIEEFEGLVTFSSKTLSATIGHRQLCRVESGKLATNKARTAALDAIPHVAASMTSQGAVMGCRAMLIDGTFSMAVLSGGQDPTCDSSKYSSILLVPAK